MAELTMAALEVPVVAIKFAVPETLWVAAPDDEYDGAALSARLQESTLFHRLCRSGEVVIDDLWEQERFTALVDLEQFEYRFFARVALTADDGSLVGQLCVLDRRARVLEAHHHDVLRTLAEMVQREMQHQRNAARRQRAGTLQDRLQRVLQMIARDEPVAVTLEALMYLVETQWPEFAATMHWCDPGGLLRPVAAPSVPDALVEATEGLPADAEAGSIGASVRDGEEVLDADIAESIHWSDMRAAVEAAGFTASWSMPVRSAEGRPALGAVTVFSPETITPTEDLRQTVAVAAHIAAVALERDRDRSLLERTRIRHQAFLSQCSEGIYRIELDPGVLIDQPIETQIKQVFERAHIAECNDVFAREHGFSGADEILGRPLLDLYGEGQDLAQLPILRAVDHGYVLEGAESCEVDQQGRQRWFYNRVQGIVESEVLVSFWGSQRDVTKQKHTEYALRESEHRYRAVVDLNPNLVMVHDRDVVECVNPAGARLLGATDSAELEGRPLNDFIDDRDLERLVDRAHRPERTREIEYEPCEITRIDGTSGLVEIASSHILHRGHPAILSVAREVTGLSLETGSSSADCRVDDANDGANVASRLKSSFLANVNHEIRTPLTAIIGFAEILGDEIEDLERADVCELVDHIRSNGQRLLWTLDSILNLSRIEAGALDLCPTPFDIVREMRNLIDTFHVMAREKGVTLEMHEEQSGVYASLDHVAFERVVGNLLANAIRDTEEGAVILQAQERARGPKIVMQATGGKYDLHSTPEMRLDGALVDVLCAERVGLAVVRSLLNIMGGHLEIEEGADEGITYTVYFDSADDVALRQAMRLLPNTATSAA